MLGYQDIQNEIKRHNILFSGSSLEVGKVHWLILKAHTEMQSRRYVETAGKFGSIHLELTAFGDEVGQDMIHWWVFKRETQIQELLKRTECALGSAQKLKESSSSLRKKCFPESYLDLVDTIKEFTEQHGREIHDLYEYVVWLHKKDVLTPSILFAYRVWGTTRRLDRKIKITADRIDADQQSVRKCVELALGLRQGPERTIEIVYSDICGNIAESADPEYQGPIFAPMERLLNQTSREVLNEFATYFEFIRKSLRNIVLEIEGYNFQTELLYRESFWESFVLKAMSSDRIENQLWDFKETLEMWHIGEKVEKERFEIKFCEHVAGYANVRGGVLIIGITNRPTRRVKGVEDLENKLTQTKKVLKRWINPAVDFVHFQVIILKDNSSRDRHCLIVAIAQTKNVISVKDERGRYSFPERLETGLDRTTEDKIRFSKAQVWHNNYNFLRDLQTFLNNR